MAYGYVELEDCEILEETEHALLVFYAEAGEEHWIPRSAVEEGDTYRAGFQGDLQIKAWKVNDLGWE